MSTPRSESTPPPPEWVHEPPTDDPLEGWREQPRTPRSQPKAGPLPPNFEPHYRACRRADRPLGLRVAPSLLPAAVGAGSSDDLALEARTGKSEMPEPGESGTSKPSGPAASSESIAPGGSVEGPAEGAAVEGERTKDEVTEEGLEDAVGDSRTEEPSDEASGSDLDEPPPSS